MFKNGVMWWRSFSRSMFLFAVILAGSIFSTNSHSTKSGNEYITKSTYLHSSKAVAKTGLPRQLQNIDIAVPDEWTCPKFYYGTNDGCDCNCGTVDPDCWRDGRQILYGCLMSNSFVSSCSDTGQCKYTPGISWTCEVELFGNNDGCHCGCGMEDPDCILQSSTTGVIGCETDQIVYKLASCRTGVCHYSNQTASSSTVDDCSNKICINSNAVYIVVFMGIFGIISLGIVLMVRFFTNEKPMVSNGTRNPMEADRVVSLATSINRDSYRSSFEESEYEGKTFEEIRLELQVAKHWNERHINDPTL